MSFSLFYRYYRNDCAMNAENGAQQIENILSFRSDPIMSERIVFQNSLFPCYCIL